MKSPIQTIDIERVKSFWYKDILKEWQPDPRFIDFLKKKIENGEYIAPVVVVREDGVFYIVNGHHRYYAHIVTGQKTIKCIHIDGTFADTEPLRKAEVLLKEYDQKNDYRYQFSGYLDRWAAAAEEYNFVNKYRPTYRFRLHRFFKKIVASVKSRKK